tara:strand:- start:427 stop:615 length:189 start_codon:yes stop_codon:yes gene_type:complete
MTTNKNEIRQTILDKMERGKKSPLKGWRMSDIIKEIAEEYGGEAGKYAREYIVQDHCNIKEG